MTAVASRYAFLLVSTSYAAVALYRAAMAILAWPVAGRFAAAALRLTLHQDVPAARIAAVGLLRDGCLLPPAALAAAGDGSSVGALGAAALANGYYFLLAAASAADGAGGSDAAAREVGPARWTLEAAAEGNGTGGWTPVGASAWRLNPQAQTQTQRHSPLAFSPLSTPMLPTRGPLSAT
jgi:hypothetical protein